MKNKQPVPGLFNLPTKISRGFTLIELLVVIAIIGVLASILLVTLQPQTQIDRAREGTARELLNKACAAVIACRSASTLGTCTDSDSEINDDSWPPYILDGDDRDFDDSDDILSIELERTGCVLQCNVNTGSITSSAECVTE